MFRYSQISTGAKTSLMKNTFHEVYNDVEKAIDYAFNGKFVLKFYDYLKIRETKKVEVQEFIESKTALEITDIVTELDQYLEGGIDSNHKQLREGYGHIPKPEARKIRNYLHGILEDAEKYKYEKGRRGSKKKTK
jgi:hypothetical protein